MSTVLVSLRSYNKKRYKGLTTLDTIMPPVGLAFDLDDEFVSFGQKVDYCVQSVR